MEGTDRPTIWLPIATFTWLAIGALWKWFNPYVTGRVLEAPLAYWFSGVLVLWLLVVTGAMTNYRSYSHIAAAQMRLWLWVLAAVAPPLLLVAGAVLVSFFGRAA